MLEKTISIVTAAYNSEKTIKRTIESVFSQTNFHDYEYIIIDGESKDNTIDIIEQYPLISFLSEPDNGIADAFNKGLKLAQGKYIFYLNSDDYLSDKFVLRDVSSFITKNNFPYWIVGEIAISKNGKTIRKRRKLKPSCKSLVLRNGIPHPAVFVNRNILENVGGFNTSYHYLMDYELWARLCEHGIHPTYLKRLICIYSREGFSSDSNTIRDNEYFSILRRMRNSRNKRLIGAIYDTIKRKSNEI